MQDAETPYRTRFFQLRLWQEQHDADAFEWRGQVTRIDTGDVCAFRSWAQLVDKIRNVVEGKGGAHAIG